MKKQVILFLAAAVGFLLACNGSKKAVKYSPDQIVPTEKSLLWRVSGNGLKKPSYVFGTIHLIPKSEFSFSKSVENALASCRRITFEIDMKEMTNLRTQIGLISKAFMPDGITLRTLLTPEDYALVRSKMDEKGLPLTMLERMKPMFLSTMFGTDEDGAVLSETRGSEAMTSIELELYKIAKGQNIPSAGLETARYQMAIFDSIPYEAQAKMLVENLRSTTGGNSEFEKMVEMYRQQDIAQMQTMVVSEDSGLKNFEDILLARRNRNWIAPMSRMMLEKPTFFAVGAGHLGGLEGVIALLRGQGFRVEAILP